MGIRIDLMSPRPPWQNVYAERLIGSIRRGCLDHVVVFGKRHLRRVLLSYMNYYNETRTHLSLDKDAPLLPRFRGQGVFFAFQSWVGCITNIFGFDLRQAQDFITATPVFKFSVTQPTRILIARCISINVRGGPSGRSISYRRPA